MTRNSLKAFPVPLARFAGAGLGIAFCLGVIFTTAKIGFSRLLVKYATVTNSLAAADEAVKLVPWDPEAHRTRAAVLNHFDFSNEAASEQEIATSLRQRDDYLWLELGNFRDDIGDSKGALNSLNEAVRLAPYYAHTHWQRGNLLLRIGRYDEAFVDLRIAASSNRTFLPNLIDLAWGLSGEDPNVAEQLLHITDDRTRVLFARFLARKGKGQAALNQFRQAQNSVSDENRRDLVRNLVEAKAYPEAFEIWSFATIHAGAPLVYDGGFESAISFDEVGFGWRISHDHDSAVMAQDTTVKESGSKSLQIAFKGASNPALPIISQTILVKAHQRYQINFSVSTRDVVTGGLPNLTVRDAATGETLGKSAEIPAGTNPWTTMTVEFDTLETTNAVNLDFLRANCSATPCPIFGVMWLDSVSIQEIRLH